MRAERPGVEELAAFDAAVPAPFELAFGTLDFADVGFGLDFASWCSSCTGVRFGLSSDASARRALPRRSRETWPTRSGSTLAVQ
jgi:hypothetical protein